MKHVISNLTTPISEKTSYRLGIVQLFLVVEVVFGHLIMIAVPEFSKLNFQSGSGYFGALLHLAFRFGGQAACSFVFLSGYFNVSGLVAIAQRDKGAAPLAFLRYRFRRIYPTLIAAIILTSLADIMGMFVMDMKVTYRETLNYDPVAALTAWAAVGNMLSLQPTFTDVFGSNGPLWTLGYLVQFYVIAAVIVFSYSRKPCLSIVGLFIFATVAGVYRPYFLAFFVTWVVGAFTRAIMPTSNRALWLLLPATVLFVAGNRLTPFLMIPVITIASALAVIALRAPSESSSQLLLPLVKWTNSLSYAVYAFHFPIALLIFCLIIRIFGTGPGIWLPYFVVTIVIVSVVALLWTRLLGKSVRRKARS